MLFAFYMNFRQQGKANFTSLVIIIVAVIAIFISMLRKQLSMISMIQVFWSEFIPVQSLESSPF